jgi:hypothetical protein
VAGGGAPIAPLRPAAADAVYVTGWRPDGCRIRTAQGGGRGVDERRAVGVAGLGGVGRRREESEGAGEDVMRVLQFLQAWQAHLLKPTKPRRLTCSEARYKIEGLCRCPRGPFLQAGLAGSQVGLHPFTYILSCGPRTHG